MIQRVAHQRLESGAQERGARDRVVGEFLNDRPMLASCELAADAHLVRNGSVSLVVGRIPRVDRNLHCTGLYVDVSSDGVIAPEAAVAPADAELLVGMAAARLDLQPDHQLPTDPNRRDLQLWFIRATEDPERRNLIMGKRALDRLAELRSPSAWIQWLKQEFDEADLSVTHILGFTS